MRCHVSKQDFKNTNGWVFFGNDSGLMLKPGQLIEHCIEKFLLQNHVHKKLVIIPIFCLKKI